MHSLRSAGGSWSEAEARVVDLPNCDSINKMVAVAGAIWCSQKNMVLIFDILSGCVEVKHNADKYASRKIQYLFCRLRSTLTRLRKSVT